MNGARWPYLAQESSRCRVGFVAYLANIVINEFDALSSSSLRMSAHQCLGRNLGTSGQYPSVSKSSRLHIDIFRLLFFKLGHNSITSS